jgi:mannose-1-phosphate guanylyltransferase
MVVRKSCSSIPTNGWRAEPQAPLLVCNEGRLFNLCAEAVVDVTEKIRQIGVQPATELLEPIARKTAPAVAMMEAPDATARGYDALLLVLPAGQEIGDSAVCLVVVSTGCPLSAPANW